MSTITETVPTFTNIPTTADPENFDDEADDFLGVQLPAFVTSVNTLSGQINTVSAEVNVNAAAAAASATAAANDSGAAMWVSGSFSAGDARWSPTDYQTYRKVGGSGGTTDPALDTANWTKISGGGAARILSATTDTSPLAWNSDLYDTTILTAQAEALTISADAGTAQYSGKKHLFIFKDNGTARALTFTTGSTDAFRAMGRVIPTTTVLGKWLYVGCVYNATSERWDVVSVAREV